MEYPKMSEFKREAYRCATKLARVRTFLAAFCGASSEHLLTVNEVEIVLERVADGTFTSPDHVKRYVEKTTARKTRRQT